MVDIRDVAEAHLRAITVPEAANQRFILNCRDVTLKSIVELLHKDFGKHYNFSTAPLPYWKAYIASYFSTVVAMKLLRWDRIIIVDNTKSKEILKL